MSSKAIALLVGGACLTIALAAGNSASAQTTAAAGDSEQTDVAEVLVTARKRDENIVDVPLAITVVSDAQLQKLDIRSTTDLAKFVPGLEFNDFTPGNSRNDRGQNRVLIFRGLNLGLGGNVTAAGGMFLDGAAVIGNEVPGGLDIGAVEVLRGPQSVYFGRSAMTGAISYRTKDVPDEWGIEINAKSAMRNDQSFEGSVAGPVIPGKVGLRLTGLSESSDGYTRNDYNGSTLGDRSRQSVSATLQLTPIDRLKVKVYANQFRDEDGPSATVFLSTPLSLSGPYSCKQTLDARVPAPFNANVIRSTLCGEIPRPSDVAPGIAVNYHNTTLPTTPLTHGSALIRSPISVADTIFSAPQLAGRGFEEQVGLQRKAFNSHLTGNLELNDYLTLEYIGGYHSNISTNAADGIGEPVGTFFQYNQYFYTLTNQVKDTSHELRLTSDPNRMFSWTAGTNYVDGFNRSTAIVAFINQRTAAGPAGTPLSPFTYSPVPQSVGTSFATTNGVFAGGYLKLLDDRMTVSAEGRYQQDKRRDLTQNALLVTTAGPFEEKFKSFNPRVAVDYDVGANRKVYASYATGTRPGGFNGTLNSYLNPASPTYNANVATQITQLIGVTDVSFKEEKLEIAELGFKGYLPNGRGYFDLNAYVGKLKDQQIVNGTLIPALGFTLSATTNIGETKIKGLEFQGNYNFTRELSLSGTLAWNHAERTQFRNTGGVTQFGTIFFDGKEMAFAPQYTGSAVLSYEHPFTEHDLNFFTNAALVYRGKIYTDIGNLTWIGARAQVDYRVGISRDKYRVEAFVANVFDNQDYTGGNVASDFGGSADSGGSFSARGYSFFGAVAPPRQFGVRLSAHF